MNREEQKRAMEALEREKRRFARQNEYIRENFDRQTVTLPKGTKERIIATGAKSVNDYIKKLVLEDLERRENAGNH